MTHLCQSDTQETPGRVDPQMNRYFKVISGKINFMNGDLENGEPLNPNVEASIPLEHKKNLSLHSASGEHVLPIIIQSFLQIW